MAFIYGLGILVAWAVFMALYVIVKQIASIPKRIKLDKEVRANTRAMQALEAKLPEIVEAMEAKLAAEREAEFAPFKGVC